MSFDVRPALPKGQQFQVQFFEYGDWDFPTMIHRAADLESSMVVVTRWLRSHCANTGRSLTTERLYSRCNLVTIEVLEGDSNE